VTVSRRVGNAVVRNAVKRKIREWFRRVGREALIGTDLVVIARPGAGALDSRAIFRELSTLVGGAQRGSLG
jgi:ribonuclease P protein component